MAFQEEIKRHINLLFNGTDVTIYNIDDCVNDLADEGSCVLKFSCTDESFDVTIFKAYSITEEPDDKKIYNVVLDTSILGIPDVCLIDDEGDNTPEKSIDNVFIYACDPGCSCINCSHESLYTTHCKQYCKCINCY